MAVHTEPHSLITYTSVIKTAIFFNELVIKTWFILINKRKLSGTNEHVSTMLNDLSMILTEPQRR